MNDTTENLLKTIKSLTPVINNKAPGSAEEIIKRLIKLNFLIEEFKTYSNNVFDTLLA